MENQSQISIRSRIGFGNPTIVGTKRSLILAAFGMITGLIVAGIGLFTAKGTSTLFVPPEDVALVNQQPISRVDYLASLQTIYATDFANATPTQRQKILDDMIREELLVQRGKELDVASLDPDVRGAMANAVEQQAAAPAITDRPTDAALRSYFETHRTLYASEGAMSVRDYVFENAANAANGRAALIKSPLSDADLTAMGGRMNVKAKGEQFYFAEKIHLGEGLFLAAKEMEKGAISDPIAIDGIHILVMDSNMPPVLLTFEAALPRVIEDYRHQAILHLQSSNDIFLRQRANILITKDLVP